MPRSLRRQMSLGSKPPPPTKESSSSSVIQMSRSLPSSGKSTRTSVNIIIQDEDELDRNSTLRGIRSRLQSKVSKREWIGNGSSMGSNLSTKPILSKTSIQTSLGTDLMEVISINSNKKSSTSSKKSKKDKNSKKGKSPQGKVMERENSNISTLDEFGAIWHLYKLQTTGNRKGYSFKSGGNRLTGARVLISHLPSNQCAGDVVEALGKASQVVHSLCNQYEAIFVKDTGEYFVVYSPMIKEMIPLQTLMKTVTTLPSTTKENYVRDIISQVMAAEFYMSCVYNVHIPNLHVKNIFITIVPDSNRLEVKIAPFAYLPEDDASMTNKSSIADFLNTMMMWMDSNSDTCIAENSVPIIESLCTCAELLDAESWNEEVMEGVCDLSVIGDAIEKEVVSLSEAEEAYVTDFPEAQDYLYSNTGVNKRLLKSTISFGGVQGMLFGLTDMLKEKRGGVTIEAKRIEHFLCHVSNTQSHVTEVSLNEEHSGLSLSEAKSWNTAHDIAKLKKSNVLSSLECIMAASKCDTSEAETTSPETSDRVPNSFKPIQRGSLNAAVGRNSLLSISRGMSLRDQSIELQHSTGITASVMSFRGVSMDSMRPRGGYSMRSDGDFTYSSDCPGPLSSLECSIIRDRNRY
eukprot:Nk52_evm18s2377 gene=Nk52_evmTU18s2377